MRKAKQIAFYLCVALLTIVFALVVDGLAVWGDSAYAVPYPAARLCRSITPDTELQDVEAKMLKLGRPSTLKYNKWHLYIGSTDSLCTLEIDPGTNRIVKMTISNAAPILF